MISNRRTRLMALAAITALWTASADVEAANVLSNGSFESNNAETIYFGGWDGIYRMTNEANQIHDWTFNTDNGKWLIHKENAFELGSPSEGDYFLNITGLDAEFDDARFDLSQTFAVVAGETYTVTYDLARRPGSALSAEIAITVDGIGLTHSAGSLGGQGTDNPADYQTFFFQFIATGDTATLNILGPTAMTDTGFYLDNIRVDGMAVPEPASLALMGFGAALLLRQRRAMK